MADVQRITTNVRSGFFNSNNDDRVYSAEDMTKPYSRIIADGVFLGEGSSDLQVYAGSGAMKVVVTKGQGIFDSKWFELSQDINFTVPNNPNQVPRMDSIIVQVDNNLDVRESSIIYRSGSPSESAPPPALVNTDLIKEFRLANIKVPKNASADNGTHIADIRDLRGRDGGTPWVSGLIDQVDTSVLFNDFDNWTQDQKDKFEEWLDGIKQDLSSVTLIRSFTSTYRTSVQDETVIPINISQFKRDIDILQVYINGLMLIKGVEYTNTNNTHITLTNGVDRNTPISFVVYKSVDGSGAESVLDQVENLQNLRITSSTGSTKVNVSSGQDALSAFIQAGKGFHTMYIQSGALGVPTNGAYRAVGHLTGDEVGSETAWLMAIQANGSTYINYLNGGNWLGWRVLHEVNPQPLYYSATGAFPNNGVNVTPSKPLSQCQHGWQLVFTGYDDDNKVARDFYTQTVSIPKKSYKNAQWNGESTAFSLLWYYGSQSESISSCVKVFRVYDDRLESGATNSTGESRNMVLRAIYEY